MYITQVIMTFVSRSKHRLYSHYLTRHVHYTSYNDVCNKVQTQESVLTIQPDMYITQVMMTFVTRSKHRLYSHYLTRHVLYTSYDDVCNKVQTQESVLTI